MTITTQLEKKITQEMEDKYFPQFEKQAGYVGNGIYRMTGTNLFSTCTRELFLMFIASSEKIEFNIN